jgi:hypothetical protein
MKGHASKLEHRTIMFIGSMPLKFLIAPSNMKTYLAFWQTSLMTKSHRAVTPSSAEENRWLRTAHNTDLFLLRGEKKNELGNIHTAKYFSSLRLFLIIKPNRCTNFSNLFLEWNSTYLDSSSVHHQEFFTVHKTICICHTGLLTACEQDEDGVPS